jgi:hypothetical protein
MLRTFARQVRWLHAALAATAVMLAACGGGGVRTVPTSAGATPVPGGSTVIGAAAFPAGSQSGSVALPAGSKLTLASLTAVNSLGTASVAATGSFVLPVYTDGPQLTIVTNASGAPVLMGWLSASSTTLDINSTAAVLTYYATGAFSLTADQRNGIGALIAGAPGISTLAAAIGNAIVANPNAFATTNATVSSALATLVASLITNSATSNAAGRALGAIFGARQTATASRGLEGVLINPVAQKSGLTPLVDFPSGFHFQNTLRRPADLTIDQVSYVNATSGATVAAPQLITATPLSIPATTGVGGGVTSTLVNIINGTYAYAPITTATTPLTNLANASSTTYQLTTVGPGAQTGDLANASSAAQTDQVKISVTFLATDFILPLGLSFLLPSQDIDQAKGEGTAAAITDLVNALIAVPGISAAAASGDMGQAFMLAYNQILESSSATNATLQIVLDQILETSGIDAQQSAFKLASGYTEVVGTVNNVLVAIDAAAVVKGLLASDRADIWTLTVTPDTVTVTPATSTVIAGNSETLTAAVPDAGGSGATFAYTWTNTAQFGHLFDGLSGHEDSFTSSSSAVTYIANVNATGTDTVGVSVADIQGAGRVAVGSTSASVVVVPSPTPSPSALSISLSPPGCYNFGPTPGTQTYTATTSATPPPNDTLAYGWEFPTTNGQPPSAVAFSDPGATFNPQRSQYIGPSNSASITVTPNPGGGEGNVSISVQLYFANAAGALVGPSTSVQAHSYFSFGTLSCPS